MSEPRHVLDRIYSLKNPAEAEGAYDEWAETYEHDTTEGLGYVAPQRAAELLRDLLPDNPRAEVLDAGCGTGLVGQSLSGLGLEVVDGIDLSTAMLDRARDKGAYRNLDKADMTRRLSIADDSYDAVICVGTFTEGHVGPEGIDELVRVARPGAPLVLTITDAVWESEGFADHVAGLEKDGRVAIEQTAPGSVYHVITCNQVVLRVR
ncbi:class I SAM-dependent methyltransferase [Nocardiopsis sp. HNM0947]|uniref:Class I SAM-dependent methyltransferase n=1 Tax=Nocardiopsis coralli TaxID=2772213 RepID=A0ABR9PB25_9ACTN|nr:class I SAM-dependent methyltransferase [Nocardiopsis coralli]MBE3001029.1 class I SAM-dependent methyltransferase [Nocardiopsis coralli]